MADGGSLPGLIVFLGSGETSPAGRRVWDWLLAQLAPRNRIAILETPAGFEPNSDRVAGTIAGFLQDRLQNYRPQVDIIAARRRDTANDPAIVAPLLHSDLIFLGPGSPTYAVRNLRATRAWHLINARHTLGAALFLTSSAVIAASRHALPVYEIYKVGEDLHWQPGLDLLGPFGLSLAIVPHWNNNDGGDELDTSRCYMGQARFECLLALLPPDQTIVGVDERTALILDPGSGTCQVIGPGSVTLLRTGRPAISFSGDAQFAAQELGPFRLPDPQSYIPAAIWQQASAAQAATASEEPSRPWPDVLRLTARREEARQQRDWATADALRDQAAELGWQIQDTPDGPQLIPL